MCDIQIASLSIILTSNGCTYYLIDKKYQKIGKIVYFDRKSEIIGK